jgi:hypothetical protein
MSDSNDNGKSGKNGTPVPFEVIPGGKAKPYKPTIRQMVFRQVALEMSREGMFLAQDWIRRCYDDETLPTIKWAEWKSWKDMYGFDDWFFEPLLDPCQIDERDMQTLEMLYWNAVRTGMVRNESWAVKEFASRRWAKNQDGQGGKEAENDLAAWIGLSGAKAWTPKSAEA